MMKFIKGDALKEEIDQHLKSKHMSRSASAHATKETDGLKFNS